MPRRRAPRASSDCGLTQTKGALERSGALFISADAKRASEFACYVALPAIDTEFFAIAQFVAMHHLRPVSS
jgi:hypothetical protein